MIPHSISVPEPRTLLVTQPAGGSVRHIRWADPSSLEYWQNGTIHELTVSEDAANIDKRVVETKLAPGGVNTTQSDDNSVSPSLVTPAPCAGTLPRTVPLQ